MAENENWNTVEVPEKEEVTRNAVTREMIEKK